jgi:hypothetical protein
MQNCVGFDGRLDQDLPLSPISTAKGLAGKKPLWQTDRFLKRYRVDLPTGNATETNHEISVF